MLYVPVCAKCCHWAWYAEHVHEEAHSSIYSWKGISICDVFGLRNDWNRTNCPALSTNTTTMRASCHLTSLRLLTMLLFFFQALLVWKRSEMTTFCTWLCICMMSPAQEWPVSCLTKPRFHLMLGSPCLLLHDKVELFQIFHALAVQPCTQMWKEVLASPV